MTPPTICGCIYELRDPRCGTCRYIGKTFDPLRRSQQHRNPRNGQSNPRYARWKSDLFAVGLAPDFAVIEDGIPLPQLNQRERHWVSAKSREGCDLLNCRVGAIRCDDFVAEQEMENLAEIVRHARDCLFSAYEQCKLPQSSKTMREVIKAVRHAELAAALLEP